MAKALKDDWMIEEIQKTADVNYGFGWRIEINSKIPTVAIKNPDGETEWFFQEHEADDLLESIPEDVNEEDYLLWAMQGW